MWSRNLQKFRNGDFIAKASLRHKSQPVTAAATPSEHLQPQPDISTLKVGDNVHGFYVSNIESIPEFNITAVQLKHNVTEAHYLHLHRNDSNNVFAISFRTTPLDSTGLPHILEHIVLCGSEQFPVRDPFFKMLNRSLATLMNAFTGSDCTMYPFSTQNQADYHNLQKIYLDAAFRPNLDRLDFMQEGWRLENQDPSDVTTDLTIKGIVYNEMKGVFAENENILGQKLQNLILPDHTYGFISGGDPLHIPSLTWEDLKEFHKRHYHPSNSKIFSYGNFPLLPTLEYLHTTYLQHFKYKPPAFSLVPNQPRWNKPCRESIVCRFDPFGGPFEKQNVLSISLVMSEITNVYDTFALNFLSELLVRGPNAAFYKTMIEPNFSGGFIQSTGYDMQMTDGVFTVGLQGLQKQDFEKVVDIYEKTVDDVILNGFDQKHIESVLHQYELGLKHEASNFGLRLFFGVMPTWNHNGEVLSALKCNMLLSRLKSDLSLDSKFLQRLVKKYFKDNNHKLILTMSPDKNFEKNQATAEKALIFEKTKNLTPQQKKEIYEKGLELQKQQNTPTNTEKLPTLSMADISPEVERIAHEEFRTGPVTTHVNTVNSNGIVYFKGVLNTSELSPEQQMLIPLLCYVINKLGTDKLNHREFDSLMNRKTSGLELSVHLAESLFQLNSYEPGILISSYCLEKDIETMWDLWKQIFMLSKLTDVSRFKMLLQLYISNLTHGLADSGHIYAMQAAAGLVSGAAYQTDLLNGMQHISYMKRLEKTSSYEPLLQEIYNISRILFDKTKLRCCLNLSQERKYLTEKSYECFIDRLPAGNSLSTPRDKAFTVTKVWTPSDAVQCQHHVLNVPVHFCSKAILTVPYTDPEYAKLRILAKYLSSKYLHPELREKRGAYGSGARMSPDGTFLFFSYRDPQHLGTLDVFDGSIDWLRSNVKEITPQELLEAKLGVFKEVDVPIVPSMKGSREFLRGLKPEIFQRHRAELMAVNVKALEEVTEKYLAPDSDKLCSKVILGPKSEECNTSLRTGELWTVLENE